jgi:hypothetical protein
LFDLFTYSQDNLFEALSNSVCPAAQVADITQAKYLSSYLSELQPQTILVEREYIDGDYLDDFASYYVRCWKPYDRSCKRLHFFSKAFTESEIRDRVINPGFDNSPLLENYLGYVVARPLPEAVIGKTVLKPYPSEGRRFYPCTRTYHANLFGVDLNIKSLAYQQQDTVLAACATVSLWSCLHMTAELFGSSCPRPASITRIANQVVGDFRPLPSRGLRLEQICHALRSFDLEPEVIRISSGLPLISLMYAYLHMGIPVLLFLKAGGSGHVVAVTGYRMEQTRVRSEETHGGCIPLCGLRIEKFYAHDDAMGPFSRLWIKGGGKTPSGELVPLVFESNHKDANNVPIALYPQAVILPVYHKIRLTFLELQMWLERLHVLVSSLWQDLKELEWDVHLTTVNGYKSDLRESALGDSETREQLLLKSHPRFIWKATLYSEEEGQILEVLADATDVKDSIPFYQMNILSPRHKQFLITQLQAPNMQKILEQTITGRFLSSLIRWSSDPTGSIV